MYFNTIIIGANHPALTVPGINTLYNIPVTPPIFQLLTPSPISKLQEQCREEHPVTYLLTYLSPWLLLENRPCTTSLQRLLSWSILSSCFQLSPVCVMSASMSRRQVFFVSPSFACPGGSTSRPVS